MITKHHNPVTLTFHLNVLFIGKNSQWIYKLKGAIKFYRSQESFHLSRTGLKRNFRIEFLTKNKDADGKAFIGLLCETQHSFWGHTHYSTHSVRKLSLENTSCWFGNHQWDIFLMDFRLSAVQLLLSVYPDIICMPVWSSIASLHWAISTPVTGMVPLIVVASHCRHKVSCW